MLHAWKTFLRRFSIRTQLFWSFSLFIMVLMLLTLLAVNTVVSRAYRTHILHSVDQSFEQAILATQNRLDMMMYVADLLYYNGELQRVLVEAAGDSKRNPADQYRDFLAMDRVFSSVELANSVSFARIFVPDDSLYANNIRHFAGLSLLTERADFHRIGKYSGLGRAYFTPPEMLTLATDASTNMITLLRVMYATNGTGIPLCVEQVGVRTEQFQQIIDNADITADGLTVLVSDDGDIICSSAETGWSGDLALQVGDAGSEGLWTELQLAEDAYLARQTRLPVAGWRLVSLIPESEIQRQARQLTLLLLALTAVGVAAAFLVSWLLSTRFSSTLNRLRDMMHQVHAGELDVQTGPADTLEMNQIFTDFTYMTEELKSLMEERYRSGAAVKSAQLRALQAQINPHFLYNTLDLINWQALDARSPVIAEIAQSLARFYRITLNRGSQVVTVEEELWLIRSYVHIENCHFADAITLKLEVPPEVLGLSCLNILLQPLVENAIKHGIAADPRVTECEIVVKAVLSDGDILFSVTDDGPGMTREQVDTLLADTQAADRHPADRLQSGTPQAERSDNEAHGYGLHNIQARVKLCYGEQYGLSYQSAPGEGTTVHLRIPAMTVEEARLRVS